MTPFRLVEVAIRKTLSVFYVLLFQRWSLGEQYQEVHAGCKSVECDLHIPLPRAMYFGYWEILSFA
jgi:hypothetical protein